MDKDVFHKNVKTVLPVIMGFLIGMGVSLFLCLSTGAFIETQHIEVPEALGLPSDVTEITGVSDAGNFVLTCMTNILLVLGLLVIVLMAVDLYYRRKDGVQ